MSHATHLRLFYFLFFSSVGAFIPYFAEYLRGIGFTGRQIGSVQMMTPIISIPAALLWAVAADRLRQPTRAVKLASLLACVAVVFLLVARTPIQIGLVLLLYGLGDRAVVPLTDAISFEYTRKQPGLAYSRLRLFGSIGYIAVAQMLGVLLAVRGDRPGDLAVPATMVLFVAAYTFVAFRLPVVSETPVRATPGDLLQVLRDRRWILLLLVCTLHWMSCAPFHLMFGVFVRDHGLHSAITGLSWAVGTGAEVLVMAFFPAIERRASVKVLLGIAFAGTALRWFALAEAQSTVAVVGLQALHGLSFGLFWSVAIVAIGTIVPSRLRATGQALFGAVVYGGGNAVGFWLAGVGYDRFGSLGPVLRWAALVEVVPLLLTVALWGGPTAWPRSPAQAHAGPVPPADRPDRAGG